MEGSDRERGKTFSEEGLKDDVEEVRAHVRRNFSKLVGNGR
jgi:hypothetical protein